MTLMHSAHCVYGGTSSGKGEVYTDLAPAVPGENEEVKKANGPDADSRGKELTDVRFAGKRRYSLSEVLGISRVYSVLKGGSSKVCWRCPFPPKSAR